MKYLLFSIFCCIPLTGFSQNLQVHYDFRHTLDPRLNPDNFPSFSFEYFKLIDTIGTGSFLMKIQADLKGKNNNVGQVFTQVTQSLRFWKPPVYLTLNYSGGLGMAEPPYGFYLTNSYGLGISYPFQYKGAWLSLNVTYRYNSFDIPSHDVQAVFYFGRGLWDYRVFVAGSFVFWTENRNQGNEFTSGLHGKKFAFFGDPQIWIKVVKGFSVGSRINVFYHLLKDDHSIQVYPTIGTKYQF